LEKNWGLNSASKFVNSIFNFIEVVCVFPEIGTIEHSELNIRGFVVVKQITIFYQIRKNKVVILSLYDNRQRPKTTRF
jgi:plasmid stabilization system protein ParE